MNIFMNGIRGELKK